MASLPPQRPSQRRASPPAESPSSQQDLPPRTNSFSAQSVDSQTLLLNSPPSQAAEPAAVDSQAETSQRSTQQEDDEEPRKCWICFNDETEDDETTSEWRSPCNCSLVAHERCLLDWIADMEAPSSRRRAGTSANKVQCPQCKAEIKIQRPKSVVVDAIRAVEGVSAKLLLPGFVLVLGTAVYTTLNLAGTHTIYQLFGPEDALQILGPVYQPPDMRTTSPILRVLRHLQAHWRLDLGLPLIPTVLVASRTTFADSFLPFLPLIFFVSSGQPGDEMMQLQWPPSAAFSFAALPYVRGFYNAFYDRVCLPREQRWLKEIQPRADAQDDVDVQINVVQEEQQPEHIHDEADGVEVDIDFDFFAAWNNGADINENPPQNPPHAQGPAPPLNAPPQDHQDAAPAPNVPMQPRRQPIRRERNLAVSANAVADTILGALIFPSIAAAMGELLNYTLPKSWVTPPKGSIATSWLGGWVTPGGKAGGRPTGFLQTRWGRSIVGGCVFVGLKDMVLLYVRWKMAQNHRRRRILDSEQGKKRSEGRTVR